MTKGTPFRYGHHFSQLERRSLTVMSRNVVFYFLPREFLSTRLLSQPFLTNPPSFLSPGIYVTGLSGSSLFHVPQGMVLLRVRLPRDWCSSIGRGINVL